MNVYETILKRRSIRKFSQKKIDRRDLLDCINAARLAPTAANLQPLEYILVTKNLDNVFNYTKWAGYLKNGTPKEEEKPTAFIVIISNTMIGKDNKYDVGLAIENIILVAAEKGIASCIIGSLNRNKLIELLAIPENYIIELAVALGYPKQESATVEFKGDVKYWLDENAILRVPKRKCEDIFHDETF